MIRGQEFTDCYIEFNKIILVKDGDYNTKYVIDKETLMVMVTELNFEAVKKIKNYSLEVAQNDR